MKKNIVAISLLAIIVGCSNEGEQNVDVKPLPYEATVSVVKSKAEIMREKMFQAQQERDEERQVIRDKEEREKQLAEEKKEYQRKLEEQEKKLAEEKKEYQRKLIADVEQEIKRQTAIRRQKEQEQILEGEGEEQMIKEMIKRKQEREKAKEELDELDEELDKKIAPIMKLLTKEYMKREFNLEKKRHIRSLVEKGLNEEQIKAKLTFVYLEKLRNEYKNRRIIGSYEKLRIRERAILIYHVENKTKQDELIKIEIDFKR